MSTRMKFIATMTFAGGLAVGANIATITGLNLSSLHDLADKYFCSAKDSRPKTHPSQASPVHPSKPHLHIHSNLTCSENGEGGVSSNTQSSDITKLYVTPAVVQEADPKHASTKNTPCASVAPSPDTVQVVPSSISNVPQKALRFETQIGLTGTTCGEALSTNSQ